MQPLVNLPDILPSKFWLPEGHFLSTASSSFMWFLRRTTHWKPLSSPTPLPHGGRRAAHWQRVWRVHCSILSPLQSDHFLKIQVYSFIHAKTQTDWLTLSAAPVTQLYPWSQRFQVSHKHGCSGRRNPHALEQQQLLNLPEWKHSGSQHHWRVKHTHPARQSMALGHIYLQKGCWSSSARPGAVAHWAVSHHMLDHRQEDLASAWPDTAESRYAFSALPAPSKDKRSFRPKGTCPHWLQVTLIQLFGMHSWPGTQTLSCRAASHSHMTGQEQFSSQVAN